MTTCAGRNRRSTPYTTSWRARTMRARVSRSGIAPRWRLEHARILQASRSDQGQAYEQEGMRRLPQNGRHLGAPPALSDVRARRMLRVVCGAAFGARFNLEPNTHAVPQQLEAVDFIPNRIGLNEDLVVGGSYDFRD